MTTPILEPRPAPEPPTPDSLEGWMDLLTWPTARSQPPRDPFPGPQTPDPGPLPKPGPSAPGR